MLDAVIELIFVIEMSTLADFVSKFDNRAMLDAVTELMLLIEMSTLADFVSKFNILGEKDAVAVFKDVNISTTCDEPETVPVGKELIKLTLPLLRMSVVTIVSAVIALVICAESSTK
jgi:hypothetical protein